MWTYCYGLVFYSSSRHTGRHCDSSYCGLFVVSHTFWLIIVFVIISYFIINKAVPKPYSLKTFISIFLGALSVFDWHTFISKIITLYWQRSLTWLSIFWGLVIMGIIFASNIGIAISRFESLYWKIIGIIIAIV